MDNVGRLLPYPFELVLVLTWHLAEEVSALQARGTSAGSIEPVAPAVAHCRWSCCSRGAFQCLLSCSALSFHRRLCRSDAVPRHRAHLGCRLDH